MLTVKKLSETLVDIGFIDKQFSIEDLQAQNCRVPDCISDETYGDESFVYITLYDKWLKSPDLKASLKLAIKLAGGEPTEWNGGRGFEVQVEYFKGYHWNE